VDDITAAPNAHAYTLFKKKKVITAFRIFKVTSVANSYIAVFLRAPTLATLDTGLVVITWQRC
jgi:hypothetical protein